MLKKDFINLSLIYLASHVWILLNHGIFWDDWVWSNNYIELHKASSEIGLGRLTALFNIFLYSSNVPIFFSKFIILLLYLATGIIFRKILDHFDIIKLQEKYYLSIFFLISPLNMTRSSLCTANNALNLFLFFLGVLLILENKNNRYGIKMLFACICLFFSYFTNSLVPFMAILYLVLFFHSREQKSIMKTFKYFFKKYYIYIALPLIFWTIKLLFFRPYGLYENYNSINLIPSGQLFKDLYYSLKTSFAEPILFSLRLSFMTPSNFIFYFFQFVLY